VNEETQCSARQLVNNGSVQYNKLFKDKDKY